MLCYQMLIICCTQDPGIIFRLIFSSSLGQKTQNSVTSFVRKQLVALHNSSFLGHSLIGQMLWVIYWEVLWVSVELSICISVISGYMILPDRMFMFLDISSIKTGLFVWHTQCLEKYSHLEGSIILKNKWKYKIYGLIYSSALKNLLNTQKFRCFLRCSKVSVLHWYR